MDSDSELWRRRQSVNLLTFYYFKILLNALRLYVTELNSMSVSCYWAHMIQHVLLGKIYSC